MLNSLRYVVDIDKKAGGRMSVTQLDSLSTLAAANRAWLRFITEEWNAAASTGGQAIDPDYAELRVASLLREELLRCNFENHIKSEPTRENTLQSR